MNKFKVGDRVRRVKHSSDIRNCPIGYETEVAEILGNGYGFWYFGEDGTRQNSTTLTDWELVSSVPASPVREVTRKEVVEGVFGRVRVLPLAGGRVALRFTSSDSAELAGMDRTELSAAIATLTIIRDALDEVAA